MLSDNTSDKNVAPRAPLASGPAHVIGDALPDFLEVKFQIPGEETMDGHELQRFLRMPYTGEVTMKIEVNYEILGEMVEKGETKIEFYLTIKNRFEGGKKVAKISKFTDVKHNPEKHYYAEKIYIKNGKVARYPQNYITFIFFHEDSTVELWRVGLFNFNSMIHFGAFKEPVMEKMTRNRRGEITHVMLRNLKQWDSLKEIIVEEMGYRELENGKKFGRGLNRWIIGLTPKEQEEKPTLDLKEHEAVVEWFNPFLGAAGCTTWTPDGLQFGNANIEDLPLENGKFPAVGTKLYVSALVPPKENSQTIFKFFLKGISVLK